MENEAEKKARELVDKFWNVALLDSYEAKQCAIIAVQEILEALDSETIIYGSEYLFEENKFWNEVLRQIEKL
jgi:hypothetical protein